MAPRRIQSAFLALGVITVVGVLGYMVFEGWSFADALYMTVITLTTVGYKEVRDLDATGQLWTMLLLITGVGTLFYAAVSSVELVVEGTIRGYFGRRRLEAAINKPQGHYILCGYGRVCRQVAREFAHDGVPFVIIEQEPATVEECVDRVGYRNPVQGEASKTGVTLPDSTMYVVPTFSVSARSYRDFRAKRNAQEGPEPLQRVCKEPTRQRAERARREAW